MATFRTRDGINLNYAVAGEGAPVVLVAGHTAPLGSWNLLRDALVVAGYRVIALDRRHTGVSDFPDHGLRMARQGADLHEFLEGVGIDGAVVVASSLGVSATLAMIDVFGTDGLRGLVLVDQTPKMINENDWNFGMYDLTWDVLDEFVAGFGSPEANAAARFRRPNAISPAAEALPLLVEMLGTPYPHETVRPLLRDHAVQDWRDVAARIDIPALAVGGRHSELWPVEHAEYLAATMKAGQLAILEHSGHAPMFTEPAEFNAAVLGFLNDL